MVGGGGREARLWESVLLRVPTSFKLNADFLIVTSGNGSFVDA
jgi:hypothetical protein